MAWRTYRTEELSSSETLQRNEQIKALSTFGNNAGLALIAAGSARWFSVALDGFAIAWSLGGLALIWSGMHVLTLLESDDG